jgi:hypothetical protein
MYPSEPLSTWPTFAGSTTLTGSLELNNFLTKDDIILYACETLSMTLTQTSAPSHNPNQKGESVWRRGGTSAEIVLGMHHEPISQFMVLFASHMSATQSPTMKGPNSAAPRLRDLFSGSRVATAARVNPLVGVWYLWILPPRGDLVWFRLMITLCRD